MLDPNPPRSATLAQAVDLFGEDLASVVCSLDQWLVASRAPQWESRRFALQIVIADSESGRCLRRSRQVRRQVVSLLADVAVQVQVAAAVVLMGVRCSGALPGLELLLRADNWRIRCQAARAVGYQGGRRAVEILHAAAGVETEPQALAWYVHALGDTGHMSAVKDLLVFSRHPDWRIRWGATRSLAQLRYPAALALIHDLETDMTVPADYRVQLAPWRELLTTEIEASQGASGSRADALEE